MPNPNPNPNPSQAVEARKAAGALPGQSRLVEEAGDAAVQTGGEDADHAEVQRAVQEAVQAAVQEGVQRAVLDATEGYAMGDGVAGDVVRDSQSLFVQEARS